MVNKLCGADPRFCRFLHCEDHAGLMVSEIHGWPCIVHVKDILDDSGEERLVSADTIDIAAIVLVNEGLADREVELELTKRGATRPIHIVKNIWSAFVCPIHLDRLHESEIVEFIEAPRQIFHNLDNSVKRIGAAPDQLAGLDADLSGHDVVIGIVDYGIDWTLPDFCDENDNTRIKYLWDQSLSAKDENDEKSPEPYAYGVEYTEDVINQALVGFRNGVPLDASPVRHRPWPKTPDNKTDTDGHGTHVTGIAAGNGAGVNAEGPGEDGGISGVAPKVWIVFVHLDRRAIRIHAESKEGTLVDSVQLLEAVHYCFKKAEKIKNQKGKPVPCVVNLSLGFNGGSHDGASALEWAIDEFLEQKGRAVTVAAGNRWKAKLDYVDTVEAVLPFELAWVVSPVVGVRDTSPNEMEIWYPSSERLSVRVKEARGEIVPPNGEGPVMPGAGPQSYSIPGLARVVIESNPLTYYNGDAQIYIRLEPLDPSGFPRQNWYIILNSENNRDVVFHAWIEKEAAGVGGHDSPQPSNFKTISLDPGEQRPFVTITTPGTCRRAITVGAFDAGTGKLFDRTSAGPTRDPAIKKPEVVAPGVKILSNDVIFDRADVNASRLVSKTGTSAAAPHVAGIIALMFQLNPHLTVDEIRDILVTTAEIEGQPRGAVFHPRWGFGIVNAGLALEEVKRRR